MNLSTATATVERPLYKILPCSLKLAITASSSGNTEWKNNHTDHIYDLVKEHMPSGSGFDSGTKIDLDASTPDKLVFSTSFHHMDESGCYAGWTDHNVVVRSSLGHTISITHSAGKNVKNRDDINDEFNRALIDNVMSL